MARTAGTPTRKSSQILAETKVSDVLDMLKNMDPTPAQVKEAADAIVELETMKAAEKFVPQAAMSGFKKAIEKFSADVDRLKEKANGRKPEAIALLRHVIRETWTNDEIATALRKHFVTNPAQAVQDVQAQEMTETAEIAENVENAEVTEVSA